MTINITGDKEVIKYFSSINGAMRSKVTESIGSLTLKLRRKVMQEKLTGQVLKVRTGTLRRSIDQVVVSSSSGVVGTVSTNVFYGKLHEYGGNVTIPAHTRMVTQAFGKKLKFPVWASVRSHTITYPERSFLRTALAEMRVEFLSEMDRISK